MKTKHLIVDLFGVLFFVNKRSILRQLGLWNLTKFYARFRTSPLDHCLMLLDYMRLKQEGEFQNIVAYKGFYLPESLCLWQKGLLENKQALENVAGYFDTLTQETCYDRDMIKNVANIIFSAEALIRSIDLNSSLHAQLIDLKKKHALFLFSNIDPQTWHHIKTEYPKVVSLFDGSVTSGESHLLKPDTAIYNHLLDTYKLNPDQCILIDDQMENCEKALQLGLGYEHYTKGKQLLI